MQAQSNIINLQEAVVIKGQRAWSYIKKSAADQRQAWCEVGEALAYGRGLHKADRAFSQWIKEQGFDDIPARTRTDAIWMAQFWSEITSDLDVAHPNAVRAAHRDSQSDLPPTPELTLEAPSKLTASIEQVAPQAKTINKLASMADRGTGQEKLTAQKYLDKKAKAFGMETSELTSLASKLDPSIGVSAAATPVLQDTIKTAALLAAKFVAFIRSTQGELDECPLSDEFAVSLILSSLRQLEHK